MNKKLLISCAFLFLSFICFSQSGKSWSPVTKSSVTSVAKSTKRVSFPQEFLLFQFNEISFKNNEEELGKEQLQKSINLSTNNLSQKLKSMQRMGDLFFEKPQYITSYFYYDSIQKLSSIDYKNKDQVDKKYKLLKNIFINKLYV